MSANVACSVRIQAFIVMLRVNLSKKRNLIILLAINEIGF